jgi:hypothetical protein
MAGRENGQKLDRNLGNGRERILAGIRVVLHYEVVRDNPIFGLAVQECNKTQEQGFAVNLEGERTTANHFGRIIELMAIKSGWVKTASGLGPGGQSASTHGRDPAIPGPEESDFHPLQDASPFGNPWALRHGALGVVGGSAHLDHHATLNSSSVSKGHHG